MARGAFTQVVLKPAGQNAVPLRAKSLMAKVLVQKNRFATTDLDLVFQNEISDRIEADFIYTVPEGAVVTDFAYFYGNERVPARVAEKERAAAIYKHITTRQRDPALVEMVGKNTFRARIFPVEPNADLRIQIRFVQVLDVDAKNRASLAVLLQTPKSVKWDSVSVTVRTTGLGGARVGNNFGIPAKSDGDSTTLSFTGTNYRTDKNFRVSLAPPTRAQTPFLAAPSGGSGGFFAVAVSGPSGTRLDPDSVRTSGVPVHALETRRLAANNLLICGRYKKRGMARFTVRDKVSGNTISTSPLTFFAASEPNNPATKFWAATRIARLSDLKSERSRSEVVALSKRFTLPSRWTSWIAIPVEERKRYHQEKAQADMELITPKLYGLMRSGLGKTRQAVALRARFLSLSKVAGYANPESILREYLEGFNSSERHTAAYETAENITKYGRYSIPAQRAWARLRHACEMSGSNPQVELGYQVRNVSWKRVDQYVQYVEDGAGGTKEAHKLRRELDTLDKMSNRAVTKSIQEHAGQIAEGLARNRANGIHGEQIYSFWNIYVGWDQLDTISRSPVRKIGEAEAKNLHDRIVRLAGLTERDPRYFFGRAESPWLREEARRVRQAIIAEHKRHPADRKSLETLERRFVEYAHSEWAKEGTKFYRANTPDGREAFAKDRLTRIAVRTEAEQTEAQFKTPLSLAEQETLRGRADALRKQESELCARMGDPLLFVDGPRDARLVIAILPNGEKMPLEWDTAAKRWQTRFDIPTYAVEGEYIVSVEIVLADGSRQSREFHYTVDVTAPSGTLTATQKGGSKIVHVEVVVATDTHRAVAVTGDGGTVPLSADPARPGRFFGRLVSAGQTVTVVLTDRAHNRTTLTATVTVEGAR